MSGIALCNNESCFKAETCFRYKNESQGDTYMEFQYICCEDNQYIWHWQKQVEIVEMKEEAV